MASARTLASRAPGCLNAPISEYISVNSHIADTTVFQGTLYELTVIRELQCKLLMQKLHQTGGAYDHGIDIRGKWDLKNIFHKVNSINALQKQLPKRYEVNGVSFKPLKHKILDDKLRPMDVLIQCKAFKTSKITGRHVRELVGAFQCAGTNKRNNTVLMMSSPNLLTRDAILVMNQLSIPFIYLQIGMLRCDAAGKGYDMTGSGQLLAYHENSYAAKLFDDCGISEWLKLAAWKTAV